MMKKLIQLIIILLLSEYCLKGSFFDEFNYYRVNTDFNGILSLGNVIIAYGTGGVLLRSTDVGNHWEQIQLDEKDNLISSAIYLNSIYILSKRGTIYRSIDGGKSWSEINLTHDTVFHKILSFEGQIYVMSNKQILVLRRDLTLKNIINISVDSNYYDFVILNRKIVYPKGKGVLGEIEIETGKSIIIDLKERGVCNNCPLPKIITSNTKCLILLVNNKLFKYDGKEFVEIVSPPKTSGTYAFFEDELYSICSQYDALNGIDSLCFYKIDLESKKYWQVNVGNYDRYIREGKIKQLLFLNKDTIFAVGANKFILVSYDGGRNWIVCSFYQPNFPFRLSETFAIDLNKYAQFFVTRNGGITWLPQKNFETLFFKNNFPAGPWNFFPIDTNLAFLFAHSLQEGSTIVLYNNVSDTVSVKKIPQLRGYSLEETIGVQACGFQDKVILSFPGWVTQNWNYTIILVLDKNFEIHKRIVLDSAHILFISQYKENEVIAVAKYYKNNLNGVYLIKSKDTCSTWINLLELGFLQPNDGPNNYNPFILKDDILLYDFIRTEGNKNIGKIYSIDIENLKYAELFSRENIDITSFITLNNELMVFAAILPQSGFGIKPLVVKNRLKNPSNVWVDLTPTPSEFSYFSGYCKDNNISMVGYKFGSLKPQAIWFASPKHIDNVEVNLETQKRLFISQPEPNPAKDFVNFRIWWDMAIPYSSLQVKISDLIGNLVAAEYTLSRINEYSGIISINSNGLQSGVYLLIISFDSFYRIEPFIILK